MNAVTLGHIRPSAVSRPTQQRRALFTRLYRDVFKALFFSGLARVRALARRLQSTSCRP
jgi:hypothetical protein